MTGTQFPLGPTTQFKHVIKIFQLHSGMACIFKKRKEEFADVKRVSQVSCNVQILFEVLNNKEDRNHESWTRDCPLSHSLRCL